MYNNEKISGRQFFRGGILENVALSIVVIPYITVNVAGNWHFYGFLAGLLLSVIYALILYYYSKLIPEGVIEAINKESSVTGRIIDYIYALRYVIRAGVILLFFGMIVHEYMLKNRGIWGIMIPFVILCGYGGLRSIEKRGRLLELLFWWMIVPLILVAVFGVCNVDLKEITKGYTSLGSGRESLSSVLYSGYLVMLVLSSLELLMFDITRQREGNWKNELKTIVWIIIAVFLAYLFVVGILGAGWVADESTAALNVMEAAAFPGGLIERMDYPVLSFWVIGVFAIVSGYLFYAKEFAMRAIDKNGKYKQLIIMFFLIALVGLVSVILEIPVCIKIISGYLIYVDVWISLIVPFLVIIFSKNKGSMLRK